MTKAVKTSTVRARLATIIKTTIDSATSLNATSCASSLSIYREEVETGWNNYTEAYNEHEDAIIGKNDDELTTITAEFSTIHSAYLQARIHVNSLIAASNGNTVVLDQSMTQHDNAKSVKLPPCTLMPFSGNLKEWVEFEATCRSMLTDKVLEVHRLQYLKDALTGEPRELVSHILPAEGAYDKAMLLLKGRYKNARAIVNNHLQQLYSIPRNDSSKESTTTLRAIVNTLNGVKAGLGGCDIDTSTWDAILIYNTSQCLHSDSLKAWEESLGGQRSVPTLKSYVDFLDTRIVILETTQSFLGQERSSSKPASKPFHPKMQQSKEQIKAYYTLKPEFKCVICTRNHIQTTCDELARMTLPDRIKTVRKHSLCVNCLQLHPVEQCPFTGTCKKCNGYHHTLLHEDSSKIMVTQIDDATISPSSDEESDAISKMCRENFYHVSINSSTLLAVALVPLRFNSRSILVNGSKTHSIVVKRIATTSQMNRAKFKEWPHLHDLPLAHPNFLDAHKIDLLIGAAGCSQIILGDPRISEGKPIALNTKLGYIVFGPVEVDEDLKTLCFALKQKPNVPKPDENLNKLLKSFWELEHVNFVREFCPMNKLPKLFL